MSVVSIFISFCMNEIASTIEDWSQALMSTERMPLKVFPQIRLASCFFLSRKPKRTEQYEDDTHTRAHTLIHSKKGEKIRFYRTTRYVQIWMRKGEKRDWMKSKSSKLLRGDTFFPLSLGGTLYYIISVERISVCVDVNEREKNASMHCHTYQHCASLTFQIKIKIQE